MSEYFITKKLDSFIGNASVHKSAELALSKRESGATLLFHGPNGCGKSTLCFQLAHRLLGEFQGRKIPEHKILNLTHSDFFFLNSEDQGKNLISIDEIRRLNEFLRYTAAEGQNKVVIIDKIDHATRSAANGLLKVLEEPPKNTFIMVVADQLGRVLPTIRSRCLKFRLKGLSFDEFKAANTDADREIYDNTSGSLTVANLFADEELKEINHLILASLFNKNNKMADVERICDAVQDLRVWAIFKNALSRQIFVRIKQAMEDPLLEKKLQYLEKLNSQIAECDLFHLDKKSIVYSVLCQ